MKEHHNTLPGPVNDLLRSFQFFTRLPLPSILAERIDHDQDLGAAAHMFPLTGLLVGLFPAIVWFAAASTLPPLVAAGFAIAVGMIVTGALHEDGLSDCADGLGGGSTRERALEIMRDSRIGAFGAAALVVSILIRCALLASLSPSVGFFALLACHSVSRSAMTIAMKTATYARAEGLGKSVSTSMEDGKFWLGLLLAFSIAYLLLGINGLTAALVAFVAAWAILQWIKAHLGGYTGDGLGAMQQTAEIGFMTALVAVWF